MARITVEDCLENVDNRFELVLTASRRARQISLGAEPRVPREKDKPTVIALREISAGLIGREVLDEPETDAVPETEAAVEEEATEAVAEQAVATEEAAETGTASTEEAAQPSDEAKGPDEGPAEET